MHASRRRALGIASRSLGISQIAWGAYHDRRARSARASRLPTSSRSPGLVLATLLAALGPVPAATAVDLSGNYAGFALVPWSATVVQTGTALQMTGHIVFGVEPRDLLFTGSVDPDTGAFSATGEIADLCPDARITEGTGDGYNLDFTFLAACASGPVHLSKCGNGVTEPVGSCADGNFVGGDCCSALCRLEPAGTACTSDAQPCTYDLCDASGTCTHVPAAGPCDDGNPCTTGDTCVDAVCAPGSPAPGQVCGGDLDQCTDDVCDAAGACTHVPVPPAVCRRPAACHSTCTQDLKECRQKCPTRGPARRTCRANCAQKTTCTAPGAPIRTLAYVVTECTTDPRRNSSLGQKLLVRRGNCDPVTVAEIAPAPAVPDPLPGGMCAYLGAARNFQATHAQGVFQHLGVLPDGSGVIYEVKKRRSSFPSITPDPPDEGIFFVRADGTQWRRIGPAGLLTYHVVADGILPSTLTSGDSFSVHPDGRTIALVDLGPDTAGHEAPQIFLLDLRSGVREQLTHQSRVAIGNDPGIRSVRFVDRHTITFYFGSPCCLPEPGVFPPRGTLQAYQVKTDGSGFRKIPAPEFSGGHLVSEFHISGTHPRPIVAVFPDEVPVNREHPTDIQPVIELVRVEGKTLLQLTNFGRFDTGLYQRSFIARGRVFFQASVNLHGENPAEISQLFSIPELGGNPRQLTHLGSGCDIESLTPTGDPVTGTILFSLTCAPVPGNPGGEQIFAIGMDGSGLRQLTATAGLTIDPDGTVHLEQPGQFAYSAGLP